jgi:glycosyltransferase involved in cell wall biosynthesis
MYNSKDNSLISAIIPARNAAMYLKEAIESVQQQDIRADIEIIVIDDGSTDNSGKIAAELGCKVITIQSQGAIKARNVGLEAAKGDFILFHDADDVLERNALTALHKVLIDDNETKVVFAKRKDFVSSDLTDEEKKTLAPNAEAYFGAMAGCALIKREVFEITGGFDETLQITGDALAWQMKLQQLGIKTKRLNMLAVKRRLHNNNMGKTSKNEEYKDYLSVLRQNIINNIGEI